MIDSAVATAADYADAMITARRAKNILFAIVLLILICELALFFTLRYKVNVSPTPSAAPPSGQVLLFIDKLKYFIGLFEFAGVAATIVLAVDLLLIIVIMLVGRLIGVSRLVAAFLWCVVLAVLLFPWQAFLINETFTSTDFKWPGVLYTWSELVARARLHPDSFQSQTLFWGRFVAWPLLALLILISVHLQSRRGLRQALGEHAFGPGSNTGSIEL